MANNTKESLAKSLKKMLAVKPIDKITVKDIVDSCKVNRQTFYYHFDDVYDLLEWIFENDAEDALPKSISYDKWIEDVMVFFTYLENNREFAINIYNSNSRTYMLKFYYKKLEACISSFALIVSQGMNISKKDFDFVVEFYTELVIGFISRWLDRGMVLPANVSFEQCLKTMDGSIEFMLSKLANEQ